MKQSLQYPNWREELLKHLRDVVNKEYHKKVLDAPDNKEGQFQELSLSLEVLINDFEPDRLLGVVFFNEKEVEAATHFINILNQFLDKTHQTDKHYLMLPGWDNLVKEAGIFLHLLEVNNQIDNF